MVKPDAEKPAAAKASAPARSAQDAAEDDEAGSGLHKRTCGTKAPPVEVETKECSLDGSSKCQAA